MTTPRTSFIENMPFGRSIPKILAVTHHPDVFHAQARAQRRNAAAGVEKLWLWYRI
jgi:hypothetical protein